MSAEIITLYFVTVPFPEKAQLLFFFDAFGDDAQLHALGREYSTVVYRFRRARTDVKEGGGLPLYMFNGGNEKDVASWMAWEADRNVSKTMAGFFKNIFGNNDTKHSSDEAPQGEGPESMNVAWLADVMRFFPIGDKVRYYPEYQKESVLETIVLGYGINKHLVYSPVDIRFRKNGGRDVLLLTADGYEKVVSEVEKFCLLIPFNRDDETKLDYVRRAELGPHGAFRRNNTVTLVGCSNWGTLSSIDTVVRRILPLEKGIYAGNEIVLLDVDPDSLALADQRKQQRLPTSLPAQLSIGDGPAQPCTLLDFSNEFVQLQLEENNPSLVMLTKPRPLTLTFVVDHGAGVKEYRLDGIMYRKTDNSLVMRLQGIYKGEKSAPLGMMDIIDIKSNLLRHPATYQALKTDNSKKNTA